MFLELCSRADFSDETLPLGQRIKAAVRRATGFSSSIGITPNKLPAKLAEADEDRLAFGAAEGFPKGIVGLDLE